MTAPDLNAVELRMDQATQSIADMNSNPDAPDAGWHAVEASASDVGPLIAHVREVEEQLRRARVERNTLRGAIQGAGLGIDADSFELTDSDGRPIGLAADTVEQLHTRLIDFAKDANVERVGLAVVRFIDDNLRIIQTYRRHRRPLLPPSVADVARTVVEQRDDAAHALACVEALHPEPTLPETACRTCRQAWPCATARATQGES